jgi:hypothetical protein
MYANTILLEAQVGWFDQVGSGSGDIVSVVTVTAGENLDKFDVVYCDKYNSSVAKKAYCNGIKNSAEVVGVVSQDEGIAIGTQGIVSLFGNLYNVDWAWTPFQWVYLSSTPGQLSQTLPSTSGEFVVPVGIATSVDTMTVSPMVGWELTGIGPTIGFNLVDFNQASGTLSIIYPSPGSVITQTTVIVRTVATSGSPTISIGVGSDIDRDMTANYTDLSNYGTYIYEPYSLAGASPEGIIATITADGQTFSGTICVSYMIPNAYNGSLIGHSFSQTTSSPYVIFIPPDNTVITRIACVIDTPASGGSPTLSVGTVGDIDRDFEITDSDLKVAGIYLYEPYTECGLSASPVRLTITPSGQTFNGRIYLWYNIVS